MNNVIYKICFANYDKFYIGSAINFAKRKAHHLSMLRGNKHGNIHLQRVYNKFGEEDICFEIVQQVATTALLIESE